MVVWKYNVIAKVPLQWPISCDSQSAIAMDNKSNYNGKSKHIDVKHHFVRKMDEQGVVKLTK